MIAFRALQKLCYDTSRSHLSGLIGALHLIRLLGPRQAGHILVQWLRKAELLRLRLPGIRTRLFCRPTDSDILGLWQIFGIQDCDVHLNVPPRLIVDGGANVGYSSVYFANKYPNSQIVAVEPDADNCALLRKNCRRYGNIRLIRGALWPSKADLIIENPHASSWAFRIREVRSPRAYSFRGITIPELLTHSSAREIDLLKLDIEGAEEVLFSSSPHDWLGRVNLMIIEVHGRASRQALLGAVAGHNFSMSRQGEKLVFARQDFSATPA